MSAGSHGPWMITGGSGFIGRSLVSAAIEHGHLTWSPSRHDLPLDDWHAVHAAVAREMPSLVIHLAGSTLRGRDEQALAQWHDTFETTRNVLMAACAADVPHVIVLGSLEERVEVAPGVPSTTYGLCKALGRQVAAHVASTSATAVDWARPAIVYGPQQLGSMLVPSLMGTAASNGRITVSDGLQQRDFLFIEDLIAWLLRCAVDDSAGGFTLHEIGSGTPTPVREVFEAVQREFPGATIEIGGRPRRPEEVDVLVARRSNVGRPLLDEWRPETTLLTGLSRTAAWWRSRTEEQSCP